ncbi:MAG: fumarylacetoacetate hydrolase family protein [Burkholderiales bacterium]
MDQPFDVLSCLPQDGTVGTLVGRAWVPGERGPSPVVVREDGVYDLSRSAPTMASLLEADDPLRVMRPLKLDRRLGSVEELLRNSFVDQRDAGSPWLLAPIDLQAIKAAGVTFASSLVERVVEEQCRGDPGRAAAVREGLIAEIGTDLAEVRPGSDEAAKLKSALSAHGLWSQYLEVGIGPDAEVFTKSQPMSAVGFGAEIGLHPKSVWNNPEPEVVLVVNARGNVVGATLGNDVNLRDFEGRSALLLGKAKDNNASCAIGPFIRLFDETYDIDKVRAEELTINVTGLDGYTLDEVSSMKKISRDVLDLVSQTINSSHQYPDGLVLFVGTMFAPTKDRDHPGEGFTHKVGDSVAIHSSGLGTLVNRVNRSDHVAPWEFGTLALMRNLRERGLL